MRLLTAKRWMPAVAMACVAITCAWGQMMPPSQRSAASTDSSELVAFRQAIRAKYDSKERAFAAGDAEAVVSGFYAPDVISVGDKIFVGRDQIRSGYQGAVKAYRIKIDSVFTYVNGEAGWDWADFHAYPKDAHDKPVTLAILFLWTRINGDWICKGDFFTYGSFRTGRITPSPITSSKLTPPARQH